MRSAFLKSIRKLIPAVYLLTIGLIPLLILTRDFISALALDFACFGQFPHAILLVGSLIIIVLKIKSLLIFRIYAIQELKEDSWESERELTGRNLIAYDFILSLIAMAISTIYILILLAGC